MLVRGVSSAEKLLVQEESLLTASHFPYMLDFGIQLHSQNLHASPSH